MKIITNLRQLRKQFTPLDSKHLTGFKKPVVTIGIFDGVHLGHKKILREVIKEARRIGGTSVVVTFDPHPVGVLDMIGAPPLLVSLKHRLSLMSREGIDVACVLNFNEAVARCDAVAFVRRVLVNKIVTRRVIVGEDFKFGKGKRGDVKVLRRLGKEYGFSVKGIPLFEADLKVVSSTRIRRLIMCGKLAEASRLLGRPVSILGTVIHGKRRGRLLGYPTANIDPHHEAIPPQGVYAVYAECGGKKYRGILNIGVRPTFNSGRGAKKEPTIEVHIFDFDNEIYGKDIEIVFVNKIRSEEKFSNKEELIKQIKIDERSAHMIL